MLHKKNKSPIALKINVQTNTPNYGSPWSVSASNSSAGTITPILFEGNTYYLTNAHVIANSTYMTAKIETSSRIFSLKKSWLDPVLDLAVVEFENGEDENFVKNNVTHLSLHTSFLKANTKVYSSGYGVSETIVKTEGTVSKNDMIANSRNQSVMTVQTSTPINPGNSGGPITNDMGACVGIASSKLSSVNISNVGYFIPAASIEHMMKDYLKYRKLNKFIDYITVPTLNITTQELRNKVLRESLKLPRATTEADDFGIYVTKVPEFSPCYGYLQEGDILHAIVINHHDNKEIEYPIKADGTVDIDYLENPIYLSFLIQSKHLYEVIKLKIKRLNENEKLEEHLVTIRLTQCLGKNSLLGIEDESSVPYYIQPSGNGGFVFVKTTANYNASFVNKYSSGNGSIVDKTSQASMLKKLEYETKRPELKEGIVLHAVLEAEATESLKYLSARSMKSCVGGRITEVNGKKITCMTDLISAFEEYEKANLPSIVKMETNNIFSVIPPFDKEKTLDALKITHKISLFASPNYKTESELKKQHQKVIEQVKEDAIKRSCKV